MLLRIMCEVILYLENLRKPPNGFKMVAALRKYSFLVHKAN